MQHRTGSPSELQPGASRLGRRRCRCRGALLTRQDGAALVTVIFLSAVILTIIIMASRSTQIELRIAGNELVAKKALDIAEAGLSHGFSLLKANTSFTSELSNGGSLASLGSTATLSGTSYRFAAFGGGTSDGYYVRLADDYDEQTGANNPTSDKNSVALLISHGIVSGAERVVEARITGTAVFNGALSGKNYITISGGAMTDSYDSSAGGYSIASAGSNGDVQSNGTITVSSSIVNGNATTASTIVLQGSGTITGTATQHAATVTYASVPACGPPYYSNSIAITPSSVYSNSSGVFNLGGGGSATLANGTYCFKTFTLSGGSTITVNGPVVITTTGQIDTSGGSVQNTTQLASNLQFYSSCVGNNAIKVTGGSGTYMTVYDPDGDIVVSGGSLFYGAMVGGSITMTGGISRIHYDEALGGIFSNPQMSSWREVRSD